MDAADLEKMESSKSELHSLLEKPQLAGIPVSHSLITPSLITISASHHSIIHVDGMHVK